MTINILLLLVIVAICVSSFLPELCSLAAQSLFRFIAWLIGSKHK